MHLSCQPTKKLDAVLPYKDGWKQSVRSAVGAREYDSLVIEEEKSAESKKSSPEEDISFRQQIVTFTGFGILMFSLAVMVDIL